MWLVLINSNIAPALTSSNISFHTVFIWATRLCFFACGKKMTEKCGKTQVFLSDTNRNSSTVRAVRAELRTDKWLSFFLSGPPFATYKGVVIIYGRGAVEFRKSLALKMCPPSIMAHWNLDVCALIFFPPLKLCIKILPPPPPTACTQILCPLLFHRPPAVNNDHSLKAFYCFIPNRLFLHKILFLSRFEWFSIKTILAD